MKRTFTKYIKYFLDNTSKDRSALFQYEKYNTGNIKCIDTHHSTTNRYSFVFMNIYIRFEDFYGIQGNNFGCMRLRSYKEISQGSELFLGSPVPETYIHNIVYRSLPVLAS